MAELRIHLGTHQTATTHFQNSLVTSADELQAAGINYIPLQQSRRTYSRVVLACVRGRMSMADARSRFAQFYATDSDGYDVVLVSDENILGGFDQTLKTGQLFPEAAGHTETARQIFDGVAQTYFVNVRSYEAFFAALYCGALRWEKHARFDAYRDTAIKNADWADLLDRIGNGLGNSPTVFEFENYVKSPKKALAEFTGLRPGKLRVAPRADQDQAMSEDAVEVALAASQVVGNTNTFRRVVAAVEGALPAGKKYKAFDPWTKKEANSLASRYSKFCKTLNADSQRELV